MGIALRTFVDIVLLDHVCVDKTRLRAHALDVIPEKEKKKVGQIRML